MRGTLGVEPLETMLEKRSLRDAERRLSPRPAPSVDPATAADMLNELERIRADHAQLGCPLAVVPLTEQDIAGLLAEVGGRGGRKARTVLAAKLNPTTQRGAREVGRTEGRVMTPADLTAVRTEAL